MLSTVLNCSPMLKPAALKLLTGDCTDVSA